MQKVYQMHHSVAGVVETGETVLQYVYAKLSTTRAPWDLREFWAMIAQARAFNSGARASASADMI